jgi:hypothetical protein
MRIGKTRMRIGKTRKKRRKNKTVFTLERMDAGEST